MALHLNNTSNWGKIGCTVSFDGSNPLKRVGLLCFLLIFSFLPHHILIREKKNQLQILSFLLIRSFLPFHPDLVRSPSNGSELESAQAGSTLTASISYDVKLQSEPCYTARPDKSAHTGSFKIDPWIEMPSAARGAPTH